ncbi:MAG: VWA domain-containing protein [Anaerocolumna sp.]
MCLLFGTQSSTVYAGNKIDLIFIIDRSGSMSSSINSVRSEIGNFTSALQNQGISYRLGLVTYESNVRNYGFTTDVTVFKQWLNGVNVGGGTENGLDAIEDAASNSIFQVDAIKYFVLIGDEVVTSSSGNTIAGTQNLLNSYDITLTAVGINGIKSQFESLSNATGGLYLDLYSGFGTNLTSIFQQIQAIPQFDIMCPSSGSVFGGTKNTLIPTLSVTDADGDALTCTLFVDSESTGRETRIITNTKTPQLVSFNTFNASTLSEGNHTLRFTVSDARDTISGSVTMSVDKTAPVTSNVSISSTDSTIAVSGSADDSLSGMNISPYRFSVGRY